MICQLTPHTPQLENLFYPPEFAIRWSSDYFTPLHPLRASLTSFPSLASTVHHLCFAHTLSSLFSLSFCHNYMGKPSKQSCKNYRKFAMWNHIYNIVTLFLTTYSSSKYLNIYYSVFTTHFLPHTQSLKMINQMLNCIDTKNSSVCFQCQTGAYFSLIELIITKVSFIVLLDIKWFCL